MAQHEPKMNLSRLQLRHAGTAVYHVLLYSGSRTFWSVKATAHQDGQYGTSCMSTMCIRLLQILRFELQ